ncbi:MAG: DMT family transporter [Proteobacteria bacterium]|nr:DMT family transporter [Pseudomonadota bacterium]
MLLAGMALFFGSQLRALAGEWERYLSGTGLIGLAAVTWAVYGLAQKQLLLTWSSQAIMLCIYAGCSLAFGLAAQPSSLASLDAVAWLLLIFASANTLVAYGTFAAALEHWEASRVSAVLALTPLATLVFSKLAAALWPQQFESASVTPTAVTGAVVVVLGSLGVALGSRDR